jgi:DNA-binding NarL/FixJ family response regulator
MAVRILLVDDHNAVRQGIRVLLGGHPEWVIVDEARDGVEAVEKANQLKPDVVVLDVTMPRMDGLEACRQIRRSIPETEVLIVTQHESSQMIREALSAGARGYVAKSNVVRDLEMAVDAVSRHSCFPAEMRR